MWRLAAFCCGVWLENFAVFGKNGKTNFAVFGKNGEINFAVFGKMLILHMKRHIKRGENMVFKRKLYDKMLRWKQESNGETALLIEVAQIYR